MSTHRGASAKNFPVERLTVIGAPSSAGAYAPGQEQAPAALREAGLLEHLQRRGIPVRDLGDTPIVRWSTDRARPRAMNAAAVANTARALAELVAEAFAAGEPVLVLGGDCTIELGTVAGALKVTDSVGLLYVDLDTDLNTPESTTDGALDWMGVAHMLGLPGTLAELAQIGSRIPLLQPHQLAYFAIDNVEPFEMNAIAQHGIQHVGLAEARAAPLKAAQAVASGWGARFDKLLVHLDVDVLDFARMPLAENTRRNVGLDFRQLIEALQAFVRAPNWAALTICELNPDHGERDGSTVREFSQAIADVIAGAPRWRSAS
jgi:arginase